MSIAEKLTTIAENDQKLSKLNQQLMDILSGVDSGGKGYYDEFWDIFQQNGNRTNYTYGFAGAGGVWNEMNFKPKYPLRPVQAQAMFFGCGVKNFTAHLKNNGITLDLSKTTSIHELFFCASTEIVPKIDAAGRGSLLSMFGYSGVKEIEEFVCGADNTFSATFTDARHLVSVKFSGVIANNIDLHWSTLLSKESITSLINTLSSSTNDKVLTLSQTAVNAIDWSNTVVNNVTCNTFDEVANTKSKWTISLV
jgi:hypothetical protein